MDGVREAREGFFFLNAPVHVVWTGIWNPVWEVEEVGRLGQRRCVEDDQ
jgi:hypothetical protein